MIEVKSIERKLTDLLHMVCVIILIGFLFAVLLYSEPYLWLEYPISESGGLFSVNLYPNIPSMIALNLSFIIAGVCCFIIGSYTLRLKYTDPFLWKIHTILLFIAGIGFLFTAIPTDTYHIAHVVGSFTMIIALYFYLLIHLFLKAKNNPKWWILIGFLLILMPSYIHSFQFIQIVLWLDIILQKILTGTLIITGLLIRETDFQNITKK